MLFGLIVMYGITLHQYVNGNISDVLFIVLTIMISTVAILFELINDAKENRRLREMLMGSLASFILDGNGKLKEEFRKKR